MWAIESASSVRQRLVARGCILEGGVVSRAVLYRRPSVIEHKFLIDI